jgi:hypothetical protein
MTAAADRLQVRVVIASAKPGLENVMHTEVPSAAAVDAPMAIACNDSSAGLLPSVGAERGPRGSGTPLAHGYFLFVVCFAFGMSPSTVDVAGSRFRIRHGKTKTARRWVAVPAWLMVQIQETCPLEDRTSERRVFPRFSVDGTEKAMSTACKLAEIPRYSPHDLRHRYASLKLREGVPVTDLAAQLGHSKKSLTLDTYSHVLVGE